MSSVNNSKAIQVATAPNEAIASMWKEILEDEGIVVALKPGGAGYSFGQSVLNEFYLLVRDDQADRAREILAEVEILDTPDAGEE